MKQYLFTIAVLFVIISSIITLNIFYQQRLQLDTAEQFSRQQLLVAQSTSSDMGMYINNLKEEAMGFSLFIAELLSLDQKEMKKKADAYFARKENIRAKVTVFDRDGTIIYSNKKKGDTADSWMRVQQSPQLQKGDALITYDSRMVYVVAPIYMDNILTGALIFENPIENIANWFLAHIKSSTKGYAWMMDDRGNLLYHPTQPEMVGKNLNHADSSCMRCHVSFDLEKKIIEGEATHYGRYIAPGGDDKILAFSRAAVGQANWIVAVAIPYSEVTDSMKSSMRVYSWLIVAIFMTAGLAVVLLVMDHRKKVRTEALEKHEQELEQYAQELEDKVKERTTELRSEKEKLDTIVSAIGGGIVLIDDKGKIQWTNETMREMAGQDIVGKSCEDICFDCDISGSYTNEDVETTVVTNLFGLKHKHFQITTAAIKGNAGEMHGYIRLVQDVTEMKKMEDQITHSEKLASIGRLVAGIAHEIGNPLTSIFSFVQILRDMENDDFKKESLDTIYFHINRISEILKQLTGFTKAPVKGKEGPCNINDVINTSIRLIQYDKKAKNIQIESDLKDSLPEIIADENQLAQVFVNLTLNAIDAMPDGGTLRVRSRKNNGTISIEFEDEGTGIPDEDLSRIFDPFFTTKEKGTGLGLSVSFGIVKKMGGTLRAQRRPEKGTIFSIDLPVNN